MCRYFFQTFHQRTSFNSVSRGMRIKDGKHKMNDKAEAYGADRKAGKGENAPEEVTGFQLTRYCCLNKLLLE